MSKKVELPMTTRKQMKKLKDVVGFRPKEPLKDRLQKAMDATGCEPAMLAEKCVDRALSDVVREILDLRKAAAAQFYEDEDPQHPGRYPDSGPDTPSLNEVKPSKPGYGPKPSSKRK